MPATIATTQEDVFTVLGAFLAAIVGPTVEVVRRLDNRVAMPASAFISMGPARVDQLATPVSVYSDPGTATGGTVQVQGSESFTTQIDCYGPQASAWADMVCHLLRHDYGCRALAPVCAPLHATSAQQVELINGEEQYEEHWYVDALLQYNPVITVSQEFSDALTVELISVDKEYKP